MRSRGGKLIAMEFQCGKCKHIFYLGERTTKGEKAIVPHPKALENAMSISFLDGGMENGNNSHYVNVEAECPQCGQIIKIRFNVEEEFDEENRNEM